MKNYLKEIKKTFGIDNDFIWDFAASNDAAFYESTKKTARIAAGPYIEDKSFRDWLDYLHEDIKRVTLSEVRQKH